MSAADVLAGNARWCVEQGDCREWLRSLPDASVDSIVTDPPAGIAFMGKAWDGDKGGRNQWIAWLAEIMTECLRVLKPGGHALIWGLPRTSHWTATAVEDAGFEVRDVVTHLFSTGFPKSLDVSKAIDKAAGAERAVVGTKLGRPGMSKDGGNQRNGFDAAFGGDATGNMSTDITAPATDAAKQWAGWGTALKPASEHWILARKPLVGTVAANVLEHGTGALNIDGCRIAGHGAGTHCTKRGQDGLCLGHRNAGQSTSGETFHGADTAPAGRWPANVALSHCDGCVCVGTRDIRAEGGVNIVDHASMGFGGSTIETKRTKPRNADGTETVDAWQCVEGCPVAILDAQSGNCPSATNKRATSGGLIFGGGAGIEQFANGAPYAGETGGASRFFYVAKPSTAEREAGCERLPLRKAHELVDREEGSDGINSPRAGAGRTSSGRRNHHATVKSIDLMRWLVRLVTPPKGVVLDPFAGSGTTGCAAVLEHFRFIGCELDAGENGEPAGHVSIARARIAHWDRDPEATQQTLFDLGRTA